MAVKKRKSPGSADLPRGVGIYKDGASWVVRLGKKFTGGEPIKKWFPTKSVAREWVLGGAGGTAPSANSPHADLVAQVGIDTIRIRAGTAAIQDLQPQHIHDAVNAVRLCQQTDPPLSVTQAVEFAIRHLRPKGGRKTLREVAKETGDELNRRSRSPRHIQGCKAIFERINLVFGDKIISEITSGDLQEWLDQKIDDGVWSVQTAAGIARHLHLIFATGVKKKWCEENPAGSLARKTKSSPDAKIISPQTCVQYIHAISATEPGMLAGIVIKAFAGVRTSELVQLQWEQISDEVIQILAANAKNRKHRSIKIQPNLAAWLLNIQQEWGPVTPTATLWYQALQRIDSAWQEANEASEKEGKPMPYSIPQNNAFRHSFGTYRFHSDKDESRTAHEMGNTVDIVRNWYVHVAVRTIAVKLWWKITPEVVRLYGEGRLDMQTFEPIP